MRNLSRKLIPLLICVFGLACADSVSERSEIPEPPTPVTLYPAYGQTATSMIITWSANRDDDFTSYVLHRSVSPDVTELTGAEVVTITEPLSAYHYDTGLQPETTYYYRVKIINSAGLTSMSNEIAATTLAASDTRTPAPVTLSPAANITQTALSLNWSISTADDFAGYRVLRGDGPGVTEATGTVVATHDDALAVDHREEGLTHSTTYYYRVLVTDTESLTALSNEIAATTLTPQDPEPPTPALLFPPFNRTSTSISLTWTVNRDDDFQGYELRRDTQAIPDDSSGTVVYSTTDPDAAEFVDTNLDPETTYFYRVVTTSTSTLTALSNQVSATTLATTDPQAPQPVTLAPASAIGRTALSLNWTVSTAVDFQGYTVLRGDSPGVTEATGTIVGTYGDAFTVDHREDGLTHSTTYYYRVLVTDTEGLTALSNEIAVTTLTPQDPEPPTPASIYPPYGATTTTLSLTWSVNRDADFQGYELRRDTQAIPDDSSGTVVYSTTDSEAVVFQDTGLQPETTYFYRVVTTNTNALTALSNQVSAATLATTDPQPPEPVTLSPAAAVARTALSLYWTVSTAPDFLSYEVLRGDSPGVTEATGTAVAAFGEALTVTYRDEGLTPGTAYYYRVRVSDTEGLSTLSNEIAVTTLTPQDPEPPTPSTLFPPYAVTSSSVTLTWTINTDDDFTRYTLLRDTVPIPDETSGQTVHTTADPGDVVFQHSSLPPETLYYYRVVTENAAGLTALSNQVSVVTLAETVPEPPDPVTLGPAMDVTQTALSLNWTVSTAADFLSYTVLRGDNPGVTELTGTPLATLNSALLVDHDDSGLTPGDTYYYRVLVSDTEGLTSLSNEIAATTLTPADPEPPTPAALYPPYGVTSATVTLTWSVNYDADFASYTLLQDTAPIPDELSGSAEYTTADRAAVLFQQAGLDPETLYYYRVVTENSAGLTALSNEVSVTTLAAEVPGLPTPVTLGPAYNISHDAMSLSWTQNSDDDFNRYELYRAEAPGVTTGDTLLVSQSDPAQTSFGDSGLAVSTEYFYRVWVFNDADDSIPSNEVSGITAYDAAPASVVLEAPTDVTGTGMTLTWGRSQSLDFGWYRLYRSESPVVDQTTVLIRETTDQDLLSFIDSGLTPDTRYYYRVYVVDEWGIATGSNIVSDTTTNTEAPTCDIDRSNTWKPINSAFAFAAINCQDNQTAVADLEVRWNFGDGTGWTAASTTKTTTYAYPARGAYWVELEVSDGTYSSTFRAPVVAGEVVDIPGGPFNMGRPAGTTPWLSMEPARSVVVDEFYINTYEVTTSEYAAFLSDGNQDQHRDGQEVIDNQDGTYRPVPGHEERPIGAVNWFMAGDYCAWAGMRLATEAEWEKAARGPATGPTPDNWFPWGDTLPQAMVPVPANFGDAIGGETVDVGSYPNGVTAWDTDRKIHDMAGNADEWVQDYYDPDYYQWANDNTDNNNPTGPAASPYPEGYRVTRGGSLANDENPLRTSFRCYHNPHSGGAMGIRCVINTLP